MIAVTVASLKLFLNAVAYTPVNRRWMFVNVKPPWSLWNASTNTATIGTKSPSVT